MVRQRKLFKAEDRKEKALQRKEKVLEASREEKSQIREKEREQERLRKLNRQPKEEFYRCQCGLLLHWRVAYGHKSGCPQCHKPIPASEIFE